MPLIRFAFILFLVLFPVAHLNPKPQTSSFQYMPLDFNGPVKAIAIDDNTLYLGGAFTYCGKATGSLAVLNASTGSPDTSFPHLEGVVSSVVPDGAGGWYIGGYFSVTKYEYRTLAHI